MPDTKNLTLFQDIFPAADVNFRVCESLESDRPTAVSGKVDYKHVLGRIVGEGFLVDGDSNNRRRYRRDLWEKQRVKRESDLNSGGLFGAFGHEQALDALALGAGKAAVLTTDFWIDENGVGMIEMLILDTDAGRNLNTYMRAGKRLPVSSRGYGSVLETTADGIDILDPDTYYLAGWDIVNDPGVGSAYPALVEQAPLTHTHNTRPLEERKTMDETTKQIIALNESNAKTSAKLEIQEAANKVTLNENAELKAKLALYEEKVGTLEQVKELSEGLYKWLMLEPFKTVAKEMGLYQDAGLKGLFPKLTPSIEAFESARSKDAALLEEYKALGKVESLKAVSESAKAYEALISLPGLKKLCESHKKIAKKIHERARDNKVNEATTRLVKAFPNVNEAQIKHLLTNMAPAAALSTIKMLSEANTKAAATAGGAAVGADGKPVNESRLDPFKPVLLSQITDAGSKIDEKVDLAVRLNESMMVKKAK